MKNQCIAAFLLLLLVTANAAPRRGMRKGGKRNKSFSRMPIVYTNPESDDYYNHPNVSSIALKFFKLLTEVKSVFNFSVTLFGSNVPKGFSLQTNFCGSEKINSVQ